MDEAKIRAWWSHLQGLDGSLAGHDAGAILATTGWARSVGGVGPYLGLFARTGLRREAVDQAVAKLEIHELPSARGCTYVVPASDFAFALKSGEGFGTEADMKTARKLGVTDEEIAALRQAVIEALEKGPLDPDALRDATGSASRSLGEEGRKKGLSTTLPLVLGELQRTGDIRRAPTNGRLDQQRYRYALWRPNPLNSYSLSTEQIHRDLARRFFQWIGPATMTEFQTFSGLGVKAGKIAADPLKLEPIAPGDARLLLPEDREQFDSFTVPDQPHYVLTSLLDGISEMRRNIADLLAPEDLQRPVVTDKGDRVISTLKEPPSHVILDRGRLVGLWEYDTTTESIAWMPFIEKNPALIEAVRVTEQYIKEDLGDARSFSLDSPKSRAPRIEQIRAAAASLSH